MKPFFSQYRRQSSPSSVESLYNIPVTKLLYTIFTLYVGQRLFKRPLCHSFITSRLNPKLRKNTTSPLLQSFYHTSSLYSFISCSINLSIFSSINFSGELKTFSFSGVFISGATNSEKSIQKLSHVRNFTNILNSIIAIYERILR